jgi:hypothetical protein
MKTFKTILFLTLISFFTGCSSNDADPVIALTTANFSGEYTLTFFESKTVKTQIIDGVSIVSTIISVGDTFTNSLFTFNSDGTYVINNSYRVVETTTVAGSSPVEFSQLITDTTTGDYFLNDAIRAINIDGATYGVAFFSESEVRLQVKTNSVSGGIDTDYSEEIRLIR